MQEQKQAPKTDHPVTSAEASGAANQQLIKRAKRFNLDLGGRQIPSTLAARFLEDLTIPEIMRMRQVSHAWNQFILTNHYARKLIIKQMGRGYLWQKLLENPSQLTIEHYFRNLFLSPERRAELNFVDDGTTRYDYPFLFHRIPIEGITEEVKDGDTSKVIGEYYKILIMNQSERNPPITYVPGIKEYYKDGRNILSLKLTFENLQQFMKQLIDAATALSAHEGIRVDCGLNTSVVEQITEGTQTVTPTAYPVSALFDYLKLSFQFDCLLMDLSMLFRLWRLHYFTGNHKAVRMSQMLANVVKDKDGHVQARIACSPIHRMTREGLLLCDAVFADACREQRTPLPEVGSLPVMQVQQWGMFTQFNTEGGPIPDDFREEMLTSVPYEYLARLRTDEALELIGGKSSLHILNYYLMHPRQTNSFKEADWLVLAKQFDIRLFNIASRDFPDALSRIPYSIFLFCMRTVTCDSFVGFIKRLPALLAQVCRFSDDQFVEIMEHNIELLTEQYPIFVDRWCRLSDEHIVSYLHEGFEVAQLQSGPELVKRRFNRRLFEALLPRLPNYLRAKWLTLILETPIYYEQFTAMQFAKLTKFCAEEYWIVRVSLGLKFLNHPYFISAPDWHDAYKIIHSIDPESYDREVYLGEIKNLSGDRSTRLTHPRASRYLKPTSSKPSESSVTTQHNKAHQTDYVQKFGVDPSVAGLLGELSRLRQPNRPTSSPPEPPPPAIIQSDNEPTFSWGREIGLWLLPLLVGVILTAIVGGIDYLMLPAKPTDFLAFMAHGCFGFNLWIAAGIGVGVCYAAYALIRYVPWSNCCGSKVKVTVNSTEPKHTQRLIHSQSPSLSYTHNTDTDHYDGPLTQSPHQASRGQSPRAEQAGKQDYTRIGLG